MKSLSKALRSINYQKKPDVKVVHLIEQKQDYIKNISPNNEQEIKAKIKEVLNSMGYNNVKLEPIDLSVYNENGSPIAIFEFKSLKNTNEMIDNRSLAKKAFWEILLNFQEERSKERGIPLWAVITNGIQWYAIQGSELSKKLVYIKHDDVKNVLGISDRMHLNFTPDRRKEKYKILNQYASKETDFLTRCRDSMITFSRPEDIAVFLSKDILADQYNPNLGNELNSDFYSELLYIFGLKEVKKKGKKQIVPNGIPNTFYHQISSRLNMRNQSLKEGELYEKTLELIIIWLNRLLFLKLFESRLILSNNDNSKYKFMNVNSITTTTKLKQLFFEVLAVPENIRINKHFEDIPYLNSSLFEEKPIEKEVSISDIAGDDEIPYYSSTILTKTNGKRKKGNVKLLDYLFKFLDAYDFSSEKRGNLTTQSNLISPAVLGLIFEKINGYKDGSYYTPTKITDYMAEVTIKKTIVSKVNQALNRQLEDYAEFKTTYFNSQGLSKREKNKVREIINNLRILDPAVGSGHFLVSALNILFYIKWDLNIKANDKTDKSKLNLNRFNVFFDGGDLLFIDRKEPFVYHKDDREAQSFQEYLFNAKQFIIENNLFGVDINPKAVEIARLRLWIELLKNAYYTEDSNFTRMETLPNIDINIKEGDSLAAPIVEVNCNLFTDSNIILDYKKSFALYQNTPNKVLKKKIAENIASTRRNLVNKVVVSSYKKFIWSIDFPQVLSNNGEIIGFDVIIANPPYGNLLTPSLKKDVQEGKAYKYSTASDISSLFVERGINLLKNGGFLTFIITYAITFNKSFSNIRRLIANTFEKSFVYSFDRDRCNIFDNMTQSVSIIECLYKNADSHSGIFTSRMFRETPDLKKIEVSSANKYLLPIGSNYSQVHRLPKIGEPINAKILDRLLTNKKKFKRVTTDGDSEIWIRTSGNYWYNAFDRKPYESSEFKKLQVQSDYEDFAILLINSSLLYFWFRVFGDGRHMNIDILNNFPIPNLDVINQYNILFKKMRKQFMKDLFSVFDNSHNCFQTSKIKDKIDLLDLVIGRLAYQLDWKHIMVILNYDKEIRGGEKLNSQVKSFVDQILAITSKETYNPNTDTEDNKRVKELEYQIDQLVYKLYALTPKEIKIIEEGSLSG